MVYMNNKSQSPSFNYSQIVNSISPKFGIEIAEGQNIAWLLLNDAPDGFIFTNKTFSTKFRSKVISLVKSCSLGRSGRGCVSSLSDGHSDLPSQDIDSVAIFQEKELLEINIATQNDRTKYLIELLEGKSCGREILEESGYKSLSGLNRRLKREADLAANNTGDQGELF